jgi:hypothetical protein
VAGKGGIALLWDVFMPGEDPVIVLRFDLIPEEEVFALISTFANEIQWFLIEEVTARPRSGAIGAAEAQQTGAPVIGSIRSMWKQGFNYGMQQAIPRFAGVRHSFVTPKEWAKRHGLKETDKNKRKKELVDAVRALLPSFPISQPEADCILIAMEAYVQSGGSLANLGRGSSLGQQP